MWEGEKKKNLSSNKKAQKGNVQMIKTGKDKHDKPFLFDRAAHPPS